MSQAKANVGSAGTSVILRCNMGGGHKCCVAAVTHIGSKGYIYCTEHAAHRCGYERTRAMRQWELALLRSGKPLPSYEPNARIRLHCHCKGICERPGQIGCAGGNEERCS